MFAIVKTGGKQYRVTKDDVLRVEKLAGEPGDMIELGDVLMVGEDGKAPTVGQPLIDKAAVFAEVVEQTRGDKIIVFKKKRRQGYRRKNGHRQDLTVLRILDVSPTGTKPKAAAKKAAPKAAAKTEDAPEAVVEASVEAQVEGKTEDKAPAKKAAKKPAAKKAAKKESEE